MLKPGNKPNIGNSPIGLYRYSARNVATGRKLRVSNETDHVYGATSSVDFDTEQHTVRLVVMP